LLADAEAIPDGGERPNLLLDGPAADQALEFAGLAAAGVNVVL
jgi:hypothetical protein